MSIENISNGKANLQVQQECILDPQIPKAFPFDPALSPGAEARSENQKKGHQEDLSERYENEAPLFYHGELVTVVPNRFVRNQELSKEARFYWILIKSFYPSPFPGVRLLAHLAGDSLETACKYLKELEARGYLKRDVRVGQKTRYHLFDSSVRKRSKSTEKDDSKSIPTVFGISEHGNSEPRPLQYLSEYKEEATTNGAAAENHRLGEGEDPKTHQLRERLRAAGIDEAAIERLKGYPPDVVERNLAYAIKSRPRNISAWLLEAVDGDWAAGRSANGQGVANGANLSRRERRVRELRATERLLLGWQRSGQLNSEDAALLQAIQKELAELQRLKC